MQRSLAKRLWYNFLHVSLRLAFSVLCHLRVRGRECEPSDGAVLVVSNHQSHLDPVIVGFSCRRRLNYLARETLFSFPPFRWLIESLDAIPIDREGMGLSGIKETLRRLKRGEMVLIFPEGTRTRDGEVAPLKPGFIALARRGKAALLPVGIDGAYRAWPRTQLLPWPTDIGVSFGPPIWPEEVAKLDDDQLLAEVERRIRRCHRISRQSVARASYVGEAVAATNSDAAR